MTPEITVITATIPGREKFLEEAVASVQTQTLKPAEHIVHLDADLVGLPKVMNILWPQVKTPWLQWLADDDILLPHHLEQVYAYRDEADIVHSYCEVMGRPGFSPNWTAEQSNGQMTATALIRMELVEKLGGWDEESWPEDYWFWQKAREAGARFVMNDQVTWIYRFHGDNRTFWSSAVAQ